MSDERSLYSRRSALKCMAFGGAGTLFALAGGVFTPMDLAVAAADKHGAARVGKPLFIQISDTHIGFNKDANPDVNGTLTQTIDLVNGLSEQPALIIHTGDITHLSKPAEFDLAQQMFSRLRTTEMHTVPGEHDTADATVTEYFNRLPPHPNGDQWLHVVTIVDDPRYLREPFYTSTDFRLEPNDAQFSPTPCQTPPPLR